jgi:hypothetical protein
MADPNTATNTEVNWGNLIGAGLQAGINYWGSNNATGALTGAEQNAIGTQSGIQGQLSSIYGTQRGLGNYADTNLAAQLGLAGQPNYSVFYNSPGYKFAVQQGDQAIQRAAAANGSLYTPNELAMLGQYNAGYAAQNYNNYINQLMQAAGLGAQGNAGLASGIYGTGANISQLQQNQGNARAGGAANTSGVVSNLLGKVPWGSIFSGGSNNNVGNMTGGGYSTYDPSTGTGNFSNSSLFSNYAGSTGYDPTTGTYDGTSDLGNTSFSNFANNSGYDPTTGNYTDNSSGF